jgi:hypothetical protein
MSDATACTNELMTTHTTAPATSGPDAATALHTLAPAAAEIVVPGNDDDADEPPPTTFRSVTQSPPLLLRRNSLRSLVRAGFSVNGAACEWFYYLTKQLLLLF